MKPKEKPFLRVLIVALLLLLTAAAIEIDNFTSNTRGLRRSLLFRFPVGQVMQITAVSGCVAAIALILWLFISYWRQNKIPKSTVEENWTKDIRCL